MARQERVYALLSIVLAMSAGAATAGGNESSPLSIAVRFDPPAISAGAGNALPWGETATVRIEFSTAAARRPVAFAVRYDCDELYNCHVVRNRDALIELDEANNFTAGVNVTIEATFLGETWLAPVKFDQLRPDAPRYVLDAGGSRMRVVTLKTLFSEQFTVYFSVVMVLFVVINTFMMGTQLQWHAIVQSARRPVGPAIGFVCQFALMPLLAFAWSFLIPSHYAGLRLGFFAVGCSPGGGASNFWTILLDGNLDLSVTMTFLSNFAALATMPFWLYTLGGYFFSDTITLPFVNIITSLLGLIIPATFGFMLGHKKPDLVPVFKRYIKIITLVVLVVVVTVSSIANWYIFLLLRWYTIVPGFLLTYSGYALAYSAAKLLRRDDRDARTIMVETGIQNGGIAILLVQLSLPAPHRDMAIVMPVSVMMFASLPLWLWLAVRACRRRCGAGADEPPAKAAGGGGDKVAPADRVVTDAKRDANANGVREQHNSSV